MANEGKSAVAEQEQFLSMEQLLAEEDIEYATVPFGKGKVCIGSLTAEDLIEWTEANDDKEKKRIAGLRLIVKSLVDKPKQKDGSGGVRIGKEEHVAPFKQKSHKSAEELLKAVLKLNGMEVKNPGVASAETKNA